MFGTAKIAANIDPAQFFYIKHLFIYYVTDKKKNFNQ